jgi:iron-sulfur cluster insertion protein
MGALINEAAPPFNVSARAAEKVKELLEKEANSCRKLRVYVTGGGCSGFQYGFEFAQDGADGDMEINSRGVQLLIDPMSFQYLMGAELDFKDDLMGSQFVINNPNATTTCGCGSSFSV